MVTDLVVAAARTVQFLGGVTLFGAPLFFLYGAPGAAQAGRWSRPALVVAGLGLLLGALAALLAQSVVMADDPAAALDPATIWAVLSGTAFGHGLAARLAATLAALLATGVLAPSPRLWRALAAMGALILASFAWTGHGAADEGAAGLVHLAADLIHLLAAGVWLGALAALLSLALQLDRANQDQVRSLHTGLARFSGVGSATVAALLLSGLINSWVLVGPSHLRDLATSAYGLLLLAKLAVFSAMLGLAGLNRFWLTPRLAGQLQGPDAALRALRLSLLTETAAGVLVLVLVGYLGALAPLSAQ
jgi:putative copper resistance protein D